MTTTMKTKLIDKNGRTYLIETEQPRNGYLQGHTKDGTYLTPEYTKLQKSLFSGVHKVSSFLIGRICRLG